MRAALLGQALHRHRRPLQDQRRRRRTFRLIISPLVAWIWLGGLIVIRRRPDRPVAGARRAPGAASARALRRARRRELGRALAS